MRSPRRACPKKQMQERQNMSDEREYVKCQYAVMGSCRQIVNADRDQCSYLYLGAAR
jgi:hypothetical protein